MRMSMKSDENVLYFTTFAREYERVLRLALELPHFVVTPRGLRSHELISGMVSVLPTSLFFINPERDLDTVLKYFIGETLWYFGGRRDLSFIKKYSKFWEKIANSDGTCNSAYGHLLFTLNDTGDNESQWRWMINSLLNDKDTRQAVMHFNRTYHQCVSNKDFVCTMYVNMLIRDDTLYTVSRMRSQDIVRGLTYDVPFFGLLLQNVYLLMKKEKYPDLKMGGMIHSSDSLHLYDEHFDLASKMLHDKTTPVELVLPHPLVDLAGNPTEFYQQVFEHRDNDPKEVFRTLGGILP
jgi:thymidylate synthase